MGKKAKRDGSSQVKKPSAKHQQKKLLLDLSLLCPTLPKVKSLRPLKSCYKSTEIEELVSINCDVQDVPEQLVVDDDEDEVPIKASTNKDKELRRLARLKQLEAMRLNETAASRSARYEAKNSLLKERVSKKKVKWKCDSLATFYTYDRVQLNSSSDEDI